MAGHNRLAGTFVIGAVMLVASAAQAQNVVVYDDALAVGWSDFSYGVTVDFASNSAPHSGVASVAVTPFNGFGALSLRIAPPLDGGGYSAIRFWVKGAAGGSSLHFFTQPTDGGAGSPGHSFVAPSSWTQVVVPLSTLGNPAAIARINVQNNTGSGQPTFYIDDMVVVAAGGSPGADVIADRVLGQAAFNTAGSGTTATTLNGPAAVSVGPDGRLFVADYENSRVLGWASARAFASGAPATLVLGQANFTSATPGNATNRLDHPEGVTVDPAGNVFVADTNNHRVMVFSPPLSNGMTSTLRFGSFDAACAPQPLNNLFCFPRALGSDAQGNIYLGDEFHHRVLIYRTPMTTDTAPDKQLTGLLGTRGLAVDASGNVYASDSDNDMVRQYDTPLAGDTVVDRSFGSGSDGLDCFNPAVAAPTATSLACPIDLATDDAGNLYVSDLYHHRVLAYMNPLTDNVPDMVFGQHGSFTTGTPNNGGLSAESIRTPLGLAWDAGSLYLADFDNNRVLAYDDLDLIFADGFE
jgi:sugar lactone lactonase YvrE